MIIIKDIFKIAFNIFYIFNNWLLRFIIADYIPSLWFSII